MKPGWTVKLEHLGADIVAERDSKRMAIEISLCQGNLLANARRNQEANEIDKTIFLVPKKEDVADARKRLAGVHGIVVDTLHDFEKKLRQRNKVEVTL